MGYSGAGGKLIDDKNQKQKILWHCPFKHRGLLARLPMPLFLRVLSRSFVSSLRLKCWDKNADRASPSLQCADLNNFL